MKIFSVKNSRNEIASSDGARWWLGTDADETSVALNALQPLSALFPTSSPSLAKCRAVFISALRKTAPSVTPSSDAERTALAAAWDAAAAFAASRRIVSAGLPVFDGALMLVGTADAVYVAADGASVPFCYAPDGYEYAGEMNAAVRILFRGLPIDCTDDPCGHYTLRNLCRTFNAFALRRQTEWHVKHAAAEPF